MIRFALACTLLGGNLLLANPSAADHFGPLTTKDQASAEIYDRILTMVLLSKVRYSLGDGADEGKDYAYRSWEEHKTLAVCINWEQSSHEIIFEKGAWTSYGYHMKGESKRNAIQNCKTTREKKYGCTCQAVDQNDENVLEVPDEFLARYMGTQPSAGPGKFDGNWGGTMACSTCPNCPGPLQKPVTITVANSEFDFAPDSSYMGVGEIDLQGNVKIRWTPNEAFMGTVTAKDFWFEGNTADDVIKLHGVRGPRECTVNLSRVNP